MKAARLRPIQAVLVYKGHKQKPLLGPYPESITKRIQMFKDLNFLRKRQGMQPWTVTAVFGESLIKTLENCLTKETLLVIPAGSSSKLDEAFSIQETCSITNFLQEGGRGCFNCGSAYWVSSRRIYNDLCETEPTNREGINKTTKLPLFDGIAKGPLCPYPGEKYNVDYFPDAVELTDGTNNYHMYLSGGGCFIPNKNTAQKVHTLARYLPSELQRLKKTDSEISTWEKATILISVGKGSASLSMLHPYFGAEDIDIDLYEKLFPNCGADWKAIQEKLRSVDTRMLGIWREISALETGHHKSYEMFF